MAGVAFGFCQAGARSNAPALPMPVTILMRSQTLILAVFRIESRIGWNCNRNCLMSCGSTPLPAAMRRRRLMSMMSGLPLLLRHRVDHALDAKDGFLGVFAAGDHVAHARHGRHQILHRSHLLHLGELLAEVVEREIAFFELLLLRGDFFLRQLLLDLGHLLDKAHDVAAAKDALGHPFRTKRLRFVQLFADADEFDRHLPPPT